MIKVSKPNVHFLTWLFSIGKFNSEWYESILDAHSLEELVLETGEKIHKDKIGNLVVDFKENGYNDSIGLDLALALNKRRGE